MKQSTSVDQAAFFDFVVAFRAASPEEQYAGRGGVSRYISRRSIREMERCFGRHPVRRMISSQLPVEHWHAYPNDPTLASAILDRMLHAAHQLALVGESLRKQEKDKP